MKMDKKKYYENGEEQRGGERKRATIEENPYTHVQMIR